VVSAFEASAVVRVQVCTPPTMRVNAAETCREYSRNMPTSLVETPGIEF